MKTTEVSLFPKASVPPSFPRTRYQGSKYKLLDWLWGILHEIAFESVLDAFSGSGCVSHYLKAKGKAVTANDLLVSNYITAKAVVVNDSTTLSENDVQSLLTRHSSVKYDNLIQRIFSDIYFTDKENRWLDMVAQNISLLEDEYKKAIAFYALFQACTSKRPYNLFHRKNLYMRTAKVERSFGNKTTWDRPFPQVFRKFVDAANDAIFPGQRECYATNSDVLDVDGDFDLVYLDPPYVNSKGLGVDYYGFYHFLEGLADYDNWERRIDFNSKHRRLIPRRNDWVKARTIHKAFEHVFQKYSSSCVAIAYRSDGIPTLDELEDMMRSYWRTVSLHVFDGSYTYVLSTNRHSTEVLLVGEL